MMHRKWKSVSALGMALLLGCLMPMHTMLAAEDDAEVVQEIEADSDTDEVSDDEVISDDNESLDDEADAGDENPDDEVNAGDENADEEIDAEGENVGDDANAADENVVDEADTDMDGQEGIQLMAATEEPQAGAVEAQAVAATSLIDIKWNGNSYIYDMGGKIDYQYVNNADQSFQITASQAGQEVSFSYYLDRVEDLTAEAKSASEIQWPDTQPTPLKIDLAVNTNYVLYVKAEADGQTVYARSGGVVIDTVAPKIVGVEAGKVYPAGTTFTVEDDNLDYVMVNESPVTPASDGSYKVKANGTNCMIRAKDKAGNEQTCSITVFGEEPEDNTVISKSGTYSLKPGVSYQLTAGKWKVGGDSTVYQGGRSFYVSSSGDYSFTKQ
ncbi:MAG: hypothetical protein HDR05_16350 [Lachnospiraceae bacterium]|nr:hypothetical protein [Lachnospiraceae bacterium]